ncbi:TetR/AcrR family transcriptional regulator [soil metagenome]
MPRISAPTVVEHRERQRAALIVAARAQLLDGGVAAVTPAAVGKRAGLARSSVYEYFSSAPELLAEIAVLALVEWSEELDAALLQSGPGLERLEDYVRITLRIVADGKHALAGALAGAALPDDKRAEFARLHTALLRPVRQAVHELGLGDPDLRVELVQGVVDAATRQVEAGRDPDLVAVAAIGLIAHGLGGSA